MHRLQMWHPPRLNLQDFEDPAAYEKCLKCKKFFFATKKSLMNSKNAQRLLYLIMHKK